MRHSMRELRRRSRCVCGTLAILCLLTTARGAGAQIAAIAERAPWTPDSPEQAEQAYFTRLVNKIEPGEGGTPERLPVYVRFFQREMINDTRLFAFHVEATSTNAGAVKLTGHVEFDENRDAFEKFLRHLGFDQIDNRVEVLPAKALGPLRYGLVKAVHSLCRAQPAHDGEVVTDSLLGDPVFLLKEAENGFFLCHTAEGYVGHIEGKDIHRVGPGEFMKYLSESSIRVQHDIQGKAGQSIPKGARLKWIRDDTDCVVAQLPAGEEVSLPASHCHVRDGKMNERMERAIENGRRLLGTPYLWGGKTSSGIDCSGLVQVAFAAEGVNLPRDSSQQVYLGRLTATRWHQEGMRRGDTLYFLGRYGKIVHTALFLGDHQYLESAGRGVRVSSFNAEDANFDAPRSKHFAFAKRLLD